MRLDSVVQEAGQVRVAVPTTTPPTASAAADPLCGALSLVFVRVAQATGGCPLGRRSQQYIGIDDGKPGREPGLVSSEADQAGEFEELFRPVYLTFHRRDGPRSQLPGASAAVLWPPPDSGRRPGGLRRRGGSS